jgi:hypothetical protein
MGRQGLRTTHIKCVPNLRALHQLACAVTHIGRCGARKRLRAACPLRRCAPAAASARATSVLASAHANLRLPANRRDRQARLGCDVARAKHDGAGARANAGCVVASALLRPSRRIAS